MKFFIKIVLVFFLLFSNLNNNLFSDELKRLHKLLENNELTSVQALDVYDEISENYIISKNYKLAIDNYILAFEKYKLDKELNNSLPEILRNIAYLYQDSLSGNRFQNNLISARYFKKIITEYRTSRYTKEALQNAIFNFRLAKEFDEALSLIKLFNKLYFKDSLSKKYLLQRANINLDLKKYSEALNIYDNFTISYPDDSLCVEALFKIGKISLFYKKNRNSINKSQEFFSRAVELAKSLRTSKVNFNKFYMIESMYELASIEFGKFKKIDFSLPLTNTIKQEYNKNKLYQSLLVRYNEILSYGNKRYSYALLKKVELLEEYGDTKYNQELDKKNNNIDDIVYRKEVYNLAGKFYEKAIKEYELAVPLLNEFIKIYSKIHDKRLNDAISIISAYNLNINKRNHTANDAITNDDLDQLYLEALESKRELLADSTLTVTHRELERAKNSIVRMQYTVASANRNIAVEYFKIRSDYHEEDSDTYFEKLYFIDNAIIPLVEKIVEAYHKTIKYSTEYDVTNEWVEKSIDEVSNYSNILSNAYIAIVTDVFKTYENYFGYSFKYAKSNKKQYVKKIGDKILVNNDIYEEMTSMIDYAKVASIKSINSFWKNLKESINSEVISKEIIAKIENNLLNFIIETERKNESVRKLVIQNYIIADSIYWENPKSNEKFYLLADYFQENNEILEELSFMILYEGYEIIKRYAINTKVSNTILHKLLEKKPADFINKTGVVTRKIHFKSDTKWLATSIFRNDFYRLNYNKTFWRSPDIINKPIPKFKISNKMLKKSISIWTKRENKSSYSVIKSKNKNSYIPADALFFRRDFVIKEIPVSGNIDLIVDDNFILIVNETTVIKYSEIEDKEGWRKVRSFDIGEYLRKGKNSIVIIATDNNKVHYGLKASLQVEVIENYDKKQVIKLLR